MLPIPQYPLVCEFLTDLPAAACIFPQFGELHFWILIEGADPGVEYDLSDGKRADP